MTDPRLYRYPSAGAPERPAYVLYWCRAQRRGFDNLALEHAIAEANARSLPLLVYEALDVRYPHANDRLHRFVLEGVPALREAVEARGGRHVFFLPRTREEAHKSRALEVLARRAAVVVTDFTPAVGGLPLWARTEALAARLSCPLVAVDDCAVVPLALFPRHEVAARTLRPRFHALLGAHLRPVEEGSVRAPPLRELALPFEPTAVRAQDLDALVASCAIDHSVPPVAATPGGPEEARRRLERFLRERLAAYGSGRNDMARVLGTGLSAHLHFGHLSARALALAVQRASAPAESKEELLEELLVRRALAFNHALHEPQAHRYESVPAWARATLEKHAKDPRAAHSFAQWEAARCSDPLWNAAQRELLRDGSIHPYARMLWGKVALTQAPSPREAFEWLVQLNDKYALDGRDPNTYANIGWCFGLHDHPYPERAIFGTVRCMTSRSAAQKWDVQPWLERVGAVADLRALRKRA